MGYRSLTKIRLFVLRAILVQINRFLLAVGRGPTLCAGRRYPRLHLEYRARPAHQAGVAPGEGCLIDTVLGDFTMTNQMELPEHYVLKIWIDLDTVIVPVSLVYKTGIKPNLTRKRATRDY